jgi:HSP20 family protein
MRTHPLPGLFDRWLAEARMEGVERSFAPVLDLAEHAEHYEIVVDLPGVAQDDVEVEFKDGALRIRGERPAEPTAENARTLRRERASGRFARTIAFQEDVDVEHIEASFRDGVLRVRVPKSERSRPRQIPVTVH